MAVLYSIIAAQEYAEILTLIMVILVGLAYIWFVWSTAKKLGNDLTSFELGQVIFLGTIVFLSGTTILGKIISPHNADAMLDVLGLDTVLYYLTTRFQIICLALLRGLM